MKTNEKIKITAQSIKTLSPGKYLESGGLYFVKKKSGGASWTFRYSLQGQRREMGLGKYPAVTLPQARIMRDKWAFCLAERKDPIEQRAQEIKDARRGDHPFEEIAQQAFEAKKRGLRGDGKNGRWFSPLKIHVIPEIGNISVDDINQNDIVNALQHIWHKKPDTAKKALNRIGIVLKHGAALGLVVDLNAVLSAKALLGVQFHQAKNIPSMPWQDIPKFYAELKDDDLIHLALRLVILTGVRSTPARNITRDQITGDVWTVPAELMKGRKGKTDEFKIPLSDEALSVISQAKKISTSETHIFHTNRGKALSDRHLSELMRNMGQDARPHGFRSSVRMWMHESGIDYNLAETTIGHKVASETVRAYLRTDHLEERAKIMQDWGEFVVGEKP